MWTQRGSLRSFESFCFCLLCFCSCVGGWPGGSVFHLAVSPFSSVRFQVGVSCFVFSFFFFSHFLPHHYAPGI